VLGPPLPISYCQLFTRWRLRSTPFSTSCVIPSPLARIPFVFFPGAVWWRLLPYLFTLFERQGPVQVFPLFFPSVFCFPWMKPVTCPLSAPPLTKGVRTSNATSSRKHAPLPQGLKMAPSSFLFFNLEFVLSRKQRRYVPLFLPTPNHDGSSDSAEFRARCRPHRSHPRPPLHHLFP